MFLKERVVYWVLIITLGVYIFTSLKPPNEDYIQDYNIKIQNLENKVDSLHNLNNELTFKVDTLNIKLNFLDKKLYLKDTKIKNLTNEINSKINSVDSFNNNQLKKFFTDRYRQYYDSIQRTNSTSNN